MATEKEPKSKHLVLDALRLPLRLESQDGPVAQLDRAAVS